MEYVFLGGAGEVGASCLLVSVANRHILFDCGIRVNQTGEDALPDIELLKQRVSSLDAIFVSHAHADHIGALPLVHAAFPQAPIYTTEPTQCISTVMLADAVRLQKREENEDATPFFTQGDTLTFADDTSVDVNCQVERFKLSAHSDQGQLLSVIKQVNPKALALVHGEQNALSALHEKICKDYTVSCPVNGEICERTSEPKFAVQITDTGVVMDGDIINSKLWTDFAEGKHQAVLKDGELIIRKTE